jgi:hypothetical protein
MKQWVIFWTFLGVVFYLLYSINNNFYNVEWKIVNSKVLYQKVVRADKCQSSFVINDKCQWSFVIVMTTNCTIQSCHKRPIRLMHPTTDVYFNESMCSSCGKHL